MKSITFPSQSDCEIGWRLIVGLCGATVTVCVAKVLIPPQFVNKQRYISVVVTFVRFKVVDAPLTNEPLLTFVQEVPFCFCHIKASFPVAEAVRVVLLPKQTVEVDGLVVIVIGLLIVKVAE